MRGAGPTVQTSPETVFAFVEAWKNIASSAYCFTVNIPQSVEAQKLVNICLAVLNPFMDERSLWLYSVSVLATVKFSICIPFS